MKTYQVHAKVKGKHIFQAEPTVQIKANSAEEAISKGRHAIFHHPILNAHYSDDLHAEENAPGGGMDRAEGDGQ